MLNHGVSLWYVCVCVCVWKIQTDFGNHNNIAVSNQRSKAGVVLIMIYAYSQTSRLQMGLVNTAVQQELRGTFPLVSELNELDIYTLTHTHSLTHTHTRTLTLTHTHSLSHTHSHTYTHALSHTLTLTHTRIHTYTLTHARTHTHAFTHALLHTHTRSHIHTRALTHTRTHIHTHARTHSHTHARTLTHSHSLTHTHTRTHTLTHNYGCLIISLSHYVLSTVLLCCSSRFRTSCLFLVLFLRRCCLRLTIW